MNNDSTKFGLIPFERLRGIGGLEIFERTLAGEFPHPPICQTLDFRLTAVESGRIVFSGTPKFDYYNPLGTIHGGYIATLLDSAMACAVHSTLAAGKGLTSLEFKINFVRPVSKDTGVLRAEGAVITSGKQVATAEAKLLDERGKLYAHSTTTCMIFPI